MYDAHEVTEYIKKERRSVWSGVREQSKGHDYGKASTSRKQVKEIFLMKQEENIHHRGYRNESIFLILFWI